VKLPDFKVTAIVEMPAGTSYKYEVDKADGRLFLDRPLNQKIPYSYGYIEGTTSKDGDPTDIFVVSGYPILPLSKVEVVLHGILYCDDNGVEDNKLIGLLAGEEFYGWDGYLTNIVEYLNTYKEGFRVLKFDDAPWAIKAYQESRVWPNPAS